VRTKSRLEIRHSTPGTAMNAADPPQSTHVVRRIILSFTLTIGLIAVIALISYGWTQLLFAAERERVELVGRRYATTRPVTAYRTVG